MSGKAKWVLLQRAARHGAKGDIEVFDISVSGEVPVHTWSQEGKTYPYAANILGSDDHHLYASEQGTGHPTLVTLARDVLHLVGRQALPDEPTSLLTQGDHLVVLTKASIHLLEPACSLDSVDSNTWPIGDADEERPIAPLACAALDPCVAWEAPELAGDVNRDGCVDAVDFDIVTQCQGQTTDPCFQSTLADLDGDGQVDLPLRDFRVVDSLDASEAPQTELSLLDVSPLTSTPSWTASPGSAVVTAVCIDR